MLKEGRVRRPDGAKAQEKQGGRAVGAERVSTRVTRMRLGCGRGERSGLVIKIRETGGSAQIGES